MSDVANNPPSPPPAEPPPSPPAEEDWFGQIPFKPRRGLEIVIPGRADPDFDTPAEGR